MTHEDSENNENLTDVNYEDFNLHVTRQFLKQDHEFERRMLQRIINVKLNRRDNKTERDAVIKTFCLYFQKIKMRETLNKKDQEFFQRIKIELSMNIFEHDVSVVVCILVNSDTTMLKKSKEDHTVIQEVAKVKNAEIFIAMIHSNDSIHMFNDDEQSQSMKKNIKNNCFTHYINRSLFECLITFKYFYILLIEQYHAIFIIDDIIFTV
jgi:hypothetical protein